MKRLSAVLIAVCVSVAACGGSQTGRFVAATTTPPADTREIQWRECERDAEELAGSPISGATVECGDLTVPRDWDDPDGDTFELALLRVRVEDQENRIGSLLVNPGGPGGSGRQLAALAPAFLPSDVLNRFDIVGFDPRGVAESDPVVCSTPEQKDAMIAADPDPVDQAVFDSVAAMSKQAVRGCESDAGDALGTFSTEQTARDMDAIREAVGDEKLTYLGYSYGTLLGAVYAQLFGDNIRAMVLDGAVNPLQNGIEASEGQAAGFEAAFNALAANCAERGQACKIGPDARATVQSLLDQSRVNPLVADDDREATSGIVLNAVIASLYSQRSWSALEQALADLRDGDPTRLFELSDSFTGRQPDGDYDNSSDANLTINCVDEKQPATVEDVRRLQSEWRAKYPMFGGPLAMTLLSCAFWESDVHDPYPTGKANGGPEMLIIGTTGDPATPYANTQILADMLGNSSVLTWRGEGHTAYPQARCIREHVNAYLIDEQVAPDGTTCD